MVKRHESVTDGGQKIVQICETLFLNAPLDYVKQKNSKWDATFLTSFEIQSGLNYLPFENQIHSKTKRFKIQFSNGKKFGF